MKRVLCSLAAMAVVLCMGAAALAQGEYFVQSVKAKVMSDANFKSHVLGEVTKGYKFAASGRTGNWIKVSYGNKEGYVSALLLSTHPPFEKTGVIKGDESDINQGVRRRASSYTSAAAARGLAADDRRRLSKEEKVDYESLDKVEAFRLSAEEINRFAEEGK